MLRLFLAALLLISGIGIAQEKKSFTNEDVLKMIQAGLPESTVLLAIEQGEPHFDTSPSALVALKEKGISPSVLEGMIRASGRGAKDSSKSDKPTASMNTAPVEESSRPGLYLQQGTEWTRLAPLDSKSEKLQRAGGMLGWSLYRLSTPQSELRLQNSRPIFYFIEDPDVVGQRAKNPFGSEKQLPLTQIIQLAITKGQREYEVNTDLSQWRFRSASIRPRNAKRVGLDSIMIQPSSELGPGQYFISVQLICHGAGMFDFAIEPAIAVGTQPQDNHARPGSGLITAAEKLRKGEESETFLYVSADQESFGRLEKLVAKVEKRGKMSFAWVPNETSPLRFSASSPPLFLMRSGEIKTGKIYISRTFTPARGRREVQANASAFRKSFIQISWEDLGGILLLRPALTLAPGEYSIGTDPDHSSDMFVSVW